MKRYLFTTSVLILGLCLMVALFNYRVDPYAMYQYRQANADWLSRIDPSLYLRITKPWNVVQMKPTAIVVGSSRSASVSPTHPSWPQNGSYNLSVPGLTLYEMLRFIEHAQANGPLSKLMIGLDFEGFIYSEPQFQVGFEESRMASNADDLASVHFIWRLVSDMGNTLLSIQGITQSVIALTGTAKVGRRYFPDGTWEFTHSNFIGRNGFISVGKAAVSGQRKTQLDMDKNLEIFADILRFAHRERIETRLFITPEHIFIVDLWWRLGHGDLWMDFHRRLLAVNNAVAVEMGVEPFPVFGFNHVRGMVDEPIRSARDSRQSAFTDGEHFRLAVGKRIMDGVWTEGDGLGTKLDTDSVEVYLSEVDQLRQEFESANTQLTTVLRRNISPDLE
jgi:hypothetical protein